MDKLFSSSSSYFQSVHIHENATFYVFIRKKEGKNEKLNECPLVFFVSLSLREIIIYFWRCEWIRLRLYITLTQSNSKNCCENTNRNWKVLSSCLNTNKKKHIMKMGSVCIRFIYPANLMSQSTWKLCCALVGWYAQWKML